MLETKKRLIETMETKVDIKEVQSALNECQKDICEQLSTHKQCNKAEMHGIEKEMFKLLDRKANIIDLQDAVKGKIDDSRLDNFVTKKELQDVAYKIHGLSD